MHYAALLALRNESFASFLDNLLTIIPKDILDQAVDSNKRNILMYAAIDNKHEIVDIILRHGADPRMSDIFGVRALDMSKNSYIVEMMRESIVKFIELDHQKWIESSSSSWESEVSST